MHTTNKPRVVGIILAAGKGTRMKSTDTNKAALLFNGKPMIQYAVELFQKTVDQTVVVTGFATESIMNAIPEHLRSTVLFVDQKEQLGTGHAVKVALEELKRRGQFDLVLVGYGDHMMFYTPNVVRDLVALHREKKVAMSLLTTVDEHPDERAWGRIVRDAKGNVLKSVEQKDATESERRITETNPSFYCFDASFLSAHIGKIEKSPVSGEYYVTDMLEIAVKQHRVVAGLKVPFGVVGVGVNTPGQLEESQDLYRSWTHSP